MNSPTVSADEAAYRGYAENTKGDYNGALRDYNNAIVLKPDFADVISARDRLEPIYQAIKEATRRAWNDMQSIEVQLARDYSSSDQIYSQRAYLYSQINSEKADPELVKYVAQVVEVSKSTASIIDRVASEIRSSHQTGETIETVYTVVGALVGALINNDRSLQQNADDGQTAGAIAGAIVNGVGTTLADDGIKQKYAADIGRCNSNLRIIDQNRAWLANYLSKKYGSQFLSGF